MGVCEESRTVVREIQEDFSEAEMSMLFGRLPGTNVGSHEKYPVRENAR